MSLQRRRRAVEAQHLRVQALRRRGEGQADRLARRTQTLWPWLWLGAGAVFGLAIERELARPPRARGAGWFGAVPWGRLLPLFERVLITALLAKPGAAPGAGPASRGDAP